MNELSSKVQHAAYVKELERQVSELKYLLARYQEQILQNEVESAQIAQATKPKVASPYLFFVELLSPNDVVKIAQNGKREIEKPWREAFLSNPLRVTYWRTLRRAQRRLKDRASLRRRLDAIDKTLR